jgi:hypothetical protein
MGLDGSKEVSLECARSIERWRGTKNSWARSTSDKNEPLGE